MAQRGRDEMLRRLVAHVRKHGLPADPSLRQFAQLLGTSHRMLGYYFGTRDAMLATVLTALRSEERDRFLTSGTDLEASIRALWAYYTGPARRREHEAFCFVFALAVRQPAAYPDFVASQESWVDLAVAGGLPPTAARLLVSGIRGLLLDRLVADDPAAADAAFELLLEQVLACEPASPS